jgi:hypothetical protein
MTTNTFLLSSVISLCFNLLYRYVALIYCPLSAVSPPSSRLFAVYLICIFDFFAYEFADSLTFYSAHTAAAGVKAAGVKSASTTTIAAPVPAQPNSAATVVLSVAAVACAALLTL